MNKILRRWTRVGLDLLFPPRCDDCSVELPSHDGIMLCDACRQKLVPKTGPMCSRCGAPMSGAPDSGGRCTRCPARRVYFEAVVSLGVYQKELRRAILRMKRAESQSLSAAISRLLLDRRGRQIASYEPDVVVPVPMYWARRLLRGTNSPDILAQHLSRYLRIPCERGLLVRRRNTRPQADLPPAQRFRNVRGAFGSPASYDLTDARVLLVDDILTTGATCSEAAKVLCKAGASSVVVAIVGRTDQPH